LLAAIGFISVVDTVCKAFTDELHAVQLVWGYFLGIFVTLCGYFLVRGVPLRKLYATSRPMLQIARPAYLVASISALFIGLTYLPLAEATAIGFTAPLFITMLSVPILKETVGLHRWLAVAAGLLGVVIIVRPGGDLWHWSAAMPLIGAMCFALYQLSTRQLATTETTHSTLFYTGLGGLIWTSVIVAFFWTTPRPLHWLVFLGTGVMGAAAHLCMIRAFERAQASLLAPFNYSKLIWVAVLGYVAFGDLPGLNTMLGSIVIMASGLYVLYRETRRPPPATARPNIG
jgi:drug/metabolite transporter (DMT)-like permease